MSAELNARSWLENSLEEEKANLLPRLEQAPDKAPILGELEACDQLLKRIREIPVPA
jgi:hypothetical protein